jgi:membrane-associated phospholipid phosphatase
MMMRSQLVTIAALLLATAGLFAVEQAGFIRSHTWSLLGDLRRESRLFEQFGQFGSGIVIVLLIWTLDPARRKLVVPVVVTMLLTAGTATALKHAIGRARPATLSAATEGGDAEGGSKYASFPSGHSAGAAATAVVLSMLYPRGRTVFWGLAVATALLRYASNAHWPSDVVGGVALGYALAHPAWYLLVIRRGIPSAAAPAEVS